MKPVSKKRKRNNGNIGNFTKSLNNKKIKVNIGVSKAYEFINKIEKSIDKNKINRINNLNNKQYYDLQNTIQNELIHFLRNTTFWKISPSDLIQFIKTLEKYKKRMNKSGKEEALIEIYHPLSLVLLYKDNMYNYNPNVNVINRIANYCDKDNGLYLKRYRQNGTIPRTYDLVYKMLMRLQEECVSGIGPWLLPPKLNKKVSL